MVSARTTATPSWHVTSPGPDRCPVLARRRVREPSGAGRRGAALRGRCGRSGDRPRAFLHGRRRALSRVPRPYPRAHALPRVLDARFRPTVLEPHHGREGASQPHLHRGPGPRRELPRDLVRPRCGRRALVVLQRHRRLTSCASMETIQFQGRTIPVREVARPEGWMCRLLVADDGSAYLEYLVSVGPYKIDVAVVHAL